MRKKTLLIGLCTFFCTVCMFFCTYSTLKVKAITSTETNNIYYQYYDESNKLSYTVMIDKYIYNSSNGVYINDLSPFITSTNVRQVFVPLREITYGSIDTFTVLIPIVPNTEQFNDIILNFQTYYIDIESEIKVLLYELPTGTSAITVQQMIGLYEISHCYFYPQEESFTYTINMQLDENFIFDTNRKYMILLIFKTYDHDEEIVNYNITYTNMKTSYIEGFKEGQIEGITTGKNEVLEDPSDYNLYTNEEYINYGSEEYQRGVNSGTSAFRSFRDIMATIFSASDSVYSTELFPGITLGLIIGLPLLLTLLIVVLKILRG